MRINEESNVRDEQAWGNVEKLPRHAESLVGHVKDFISLCEIRSLIIGQF